MAPHITVLYSPCTSVQSTLVLQALGRSLIDLQCGRRCLTVFTKGLEGAAKYGRAKRLSPVVDLRALWPVLISIPYLPWLPRIVSGAVSLESPVCSDRGSPGERNRFRARSTARVAVAPGHIALRRGQTRRRARQVGRGACMKRRSSVTGHAAALPTCLSQRRPAAQRIVRLAMSCVECRFSRWDDGECGLNTP